MSTASPVSRAIPSCSRLCAVDGRRPWFVVDVEVRQVFSHCGKAFVRSRLCGTRAVARSPRVSTPSRSIAAPPRARGGDEADVRREVEHSYVPDVLYGDPARH